MPPIDFDQRVTTVKNEKVALKERAEEADTLGDLCLFALQSATLPAPTDPTESYARYKLGRRLEKGGALDLQAADVQLIRKCAGALFSPFAFGAVADLIDPPPQNG